MSDRDYIDYLLDMQDACKKSTDFIQGLDYNTFVTDAKTIYALIRCFEIIGEASTKIPEQIKKLHADIPWRYMSSMRNKLIHEYYGVDVKIIWKTVTEEIPGLTSKIDNLIIKLG